MMGLYRETYRPKHPHADKQGMIGEHIIVAESVLGRFLSRGNVVHHVNGHQKDNQKRNLVICENGSFHNTLHVRQRALKLFGDAHAIQCRYCWKPFLPGDKGTNIIRTPKPDNGRRARVLAYHYSCRSRYRRKKYALKYPIPERKRLPL